VRSTIDRGIARTIFTVEEDVMILLHGFVKKSAKIPTTDLQVARDRRSKLRGCHD
jgi:phage-related protein